jgi:hypothetical protein
MHVGPAETLVMVNELKFTDEDSWLFRGDWLEVAICMENSRFAPECL